MFQPQHLGQKALLIAAFFIIVIGSTKIAQADWTPPASAPPGGNVAAPINVSGTSQTKQGSLTIAGEYLALPAGGLFFSQSHIYEEPHINYSGGTLFLSPGDSGDHTELQGKVIITQTMGSQGELRVQNLVNCPSLKTNAEGKLECDLTGGDGIDGSGTANYLPKWQDSDTLTDSTLYEHVDALNNKFVGINWRTIIGLPTASLSVGPSKDTAMGGLAAIDLSSGYGFDWRIKSDFTNIGRAWERRFFIDEAKQAFTLNGIGQTGLGTLTPTARLTVRGRPDGDNVDAGKIITNGVTVTEGTGETYFEFFNRGDLLYSARLNEYRVIASIDQTNPSPQRLTLTQPFSQNLTDEDYEMRPSIARFEDKDGLTRLLVNASGNVRIDQAGDLVVGGSLTDGGTADGVSEICLNNDCISSWSAAGSSLPGGSSSQTLRHDGTNWIANSLLFNNGSQVSVGVTDPANRFEVGQDLGGYLALRRDDADNNISGGDDLGALYFTGDHGAVSDIIGAKIKAKASDNWAANVYPTVLSFFTRGATGSETERLTIDSQGRIGIGTTNPQELLHVNGTIRTNMANCPYLKTNALGNIVCPSPASTPPTGSFFPMGAGLNGEVRAATVYQGRLYVGGDFTASGATTLNHIAEWNGTSWQPVGTGTNGTVWSFGQAHDWLWVGGDFTQANGVNRRNLAIWDTNSWGSIPNGATFDGSVRSLRGHDGSYDCMIIAGYFSSPQAFNTAWCSNWGWTPTASFNGPIYGDINMSQGSIMGGAFTNHNGCPYAFYSGTNVFTCLNLNGPAYTMLDDWLGGGFSTSTIQHLGRYANSTVIYNAAANGTVKWLAKDSNERVVAVGDFTAIGGFLNNHVARYDNNTWEAYGTGANGVVNTAINFNGDLIVGGLFNSLNGVAAANIGYWRD